MYKVVIKRSARQRHRVQELSRAGTACGTSGTRGGNKVTLAPRRLKKRVSLPGEWEQREKEGFLQGRQAPGSFACVFLQNRNPDFQRLEQEVRGSRDFLQANANASSLSVCTTETHINCKHSTDTEPSHCIYVLHRSAEKAAGGGRSQHLST